MIVERYQVDVCGVKAERSLATQKVAGSNLGRSASGFSLNKLPTRMCLSPSSITWYRPMAVTLFGWEGNRRPGGE